jgi:hypothetical protein
MKNVILTVVTVFAINTVFAQKVKESEVPAAVKSSFQNSYKGAKAEKWEKEKDGNYEAEFDWNKAEMSANFNADGKLIQSEQEIKTTELPKTVSDYVTKNYAGYTISEAAKITDAAGAISYEAEVKKGKEEMDLIFDSNGNFLKKEIEIKD